MGPMSNAPRRRQQVIIILAKCGSRRVLAIVRVGTCGRWPLEMQVLGSTDLTPRYPESRDICVQNRCSCKAQSPSALILCKALTGLAGWRQRLDDAGGRFHRAAMLLRARPLGKYTSDLPAMVSRFSARPSRCISRSCGKNQSSKLAQETAPRYAVSFLEVLHSFRVLFQRMSL